MFIDNYLSEEAAARWRARLRYDDAVQRLTVPGHMISTLRTTPLSTATKLAAESKALDPGLSTVNVWKVQWSNMIATGACDQAALSSDAKERLDGYLHQDPSETIDWLSGLALTARLDDEVNFEQVIPLVKMLSSAHAVWKNEYDKTLGAPGEPITGARIAARFTERPTPNEVAVVADMAAGVLERRTAMNHEAVTADERRELMDLMDGCADVAVRVLAALGKNGAPEKVIAWAHSRLHADQGRLPLRELAAHDGLPDGEIAWVLQTLGFGGDAADRKHAFVEAREWLETIAEIRPLPNDIVSSLIDYAVERTSAGDYDSAHEASLLVAGALPTLSPRDEDRLRGLLSAFEPKTSPLPASLPVVEELGLVAATGVKLSADRRAILAGIIDDSSPDDPARITFIEKDRSGGTGPTQLVPGLTSTHLLAFARFVMGAGEKDPIVADKRTRPFLEQAIADGIRFGVRAELLREPVAAAALALRQTDGPPDATLIRAEIRRHPDDSARRSAAIQIATVGLKTLLLQQRVHVLDELRAMWGAEQEPETKFALATTIIDTISEFDRTRRDVP